MKENFPNDLKEVLASCPMTDRFGRSRSVSLFVETVRPTQEGFVPIFTLKENDWEMDGVKYFSLRKIYLSYDHIPGMEYEFAIDVFGSWETWDGLRKNRTIRHHIDRWREEMEFKVRAMAIKNMIETSKSGGPGAAAAARWLAEKGYVPKAERGRPTKAEVAREVKIQADIKNTLDTDLERLGIVVNNK